MKSHPYPQRDYSFGQTILTLRTAMNLSQVELAHLLKISRIAVQSWEAGNSYPKLEHLKHLIEFALQFQAFAASREEEEIRGLWRAAHQKVLLDEHWLSAVLSHASRMPSSTSSLLVESPGISSPTETTPSMRVDWGGALEVSNFYGRLWELATLEQWVVQERCRVVSVVGMGGIGKSVLVVTLMHRVAEHFQGVLFRSLRDSPSCEALLDDCLHVLSPQLLIPASASLEHHLTLLLECLRQRRILLVLDNLETLLQEGEMRERYRPGYEGYQRLLQRVSETKHSSCLLLTSREQPASLAPFVGMHSPVRKLRLAGLDTAASEQLLAEKGVVGTSQEWVRLTQAYMGNPLALKVVAETILALFDGSISPFLTQGALLFGSIQEVLAEQISRLSALEQTVLRWMAIRRQPLTFEELVMLLGTPQPPNQVLEATSTLLRRSLLERGKRAASLTLHSVVLEYVTEVLIEEAISELVHGTLSRLLDHGLSLADVSEDVRKTQEQLLIAPILASLSRIYPGRDEVEAHLLALMEQLRQRAASAQGYGPANVVTLLRQQRGDLRHLDLSRLVLRGAYFQGVEMQDTTLVESTLPETVWTSALDAIWKIAISSNEQYWAAGCRDGNVWVWHTKEKHRYQSWQAHTDVVTALAFSPDERLLASGSLDGTITLWEVESRTPLWTVKHTTCVSIAFVSDGRTLASSSADEGIVRLWDTTSGLLEQAVSHPAPVFSVAWSSDGCLLACGSADGSIQVWKMQGIQSGTRVARLVGHSHLVRGLAFAPGGTRLASGSWDQTIRVWDIESEQCLHILEGHTERIHTVAWSPDGRTLASGGLDATIRLWDVELDRSRLLLQGHSAPVYSLAFTSDSQNMLSGSEDGTVRMWDVEQGQCIRMVQGYAVSLSDVAWSPDGLHIVSAGSDMLVTIWSMTKKMPLRKLSGHRWSVHGVGWSPDGKRLVSSGWDNAIRVWDSTTGRCIHVLHNTENPDNAFYDVAWSPNGQWLASGSYRGGVQMWDMARYTLRWVSHAQFTVIRHVAWSSDGTHLAGGGDNGSLSLWNASDGSLLTKLQGHQGTIESITWSPDGRSVVSGGGSRRNGEMFLWDISTGEQVRTFSNVPSKVLALNWSGRGEVLISGSSDGKLRWWDVQRGECIMTREGHEGAVQSLSVSPNERQLASCGDDGAIRIWDLESGKSVGTLRRDRPYERLNITGVKGLAETQKVTLQALGAIQELSLN